MAKTEIAVLLALASALARQLTGVTMMPANWQAQWMVAASQRFCSTVTR